MRTTLERTQFDQPNLTAAPATPSCCCCCCCCIAAMVPVSAMAAAAAQQEAKRHDRKLGGLATLLAMLTPWVGAFVSIAASNSDFGLLGAAVAGPGVGFILLVTAFLLAGMPTPKALRIGGAFAVLGGIAIPLELWFFRLLQAIGVHPLVTIGVYLAATCAVWVFVANPYIRQRSSKRRWPLSASAQARSAQL